MSNNGKGKSFWHTLPGILTGIAAIITAITGLVLGLSATGIFNLSSPSQSTPTPIPTQSTPTPIPTQAPFSAPTLISPTNGMEYSGLPQSINFVWSDVSGAELYYIQIDYKVNGIWFSETSAAGATRMPSVTGTTNNYFRTFFEGNDYRWRVNAVDPSGKEYWSTWWVFMIR